MPRPANLISLFWGSASTPNAQKVDIATQTNIFYDNIECQTDFDEGNVCVSCQTSLDNDTDWNHEVINIHLSLYIHFTNLKYCKLNKHTDHSFISGTYF